MVLEFHPEKSARNAAERGLPFEMINDVDWPRVLVLEDDRREYQKLRLLLFGYLGGRLHVAVVTPREEDLRVISLRRANIRESRLYEQDVGPRGGAC